MRFIKKPAPPQGNGPQEVWLRRFLEWVSQLECVSVLGGIKKPHPNGGYSIIVSPSSGVGDTNPFRITQSADWLTYKVSDGIAITTGDPISVTNVDTDITITAGVEFYWIYLEMTATTAEVKASATTLEWSSLLIPIGWVDTLTHEADEVATINQVLRDNVFNPCVT
jgi:hypothetical protein